MCSSRLLAWLACQVCIDPRSACKEAPVDCGDFRDRPLCHGKILGAEWALPARAVAVTEGADAGVYFEPRRGFQS